MRKEWICQNIPNNSGMDVVFLFLCSCRDVNVKRNLYGLN